MSTPQTTPTRDEAVPAGWKLVPVEPTEAMMAIGRTCGTNSANTYAAMLASAPVPASGGVDAVGVCGISADTESKRVLKLHFKHEVTDADRKTIIDAFNALNRERRSALSPAATPVSEAETVAWQTVSDFVDEMLRDWSGGDDCRMGFGVNGATVTKGQFRAVRSALASLSPAATPEVALCEDEGCPHHGRPHICTPVTAEMVTAAMRAFEPLSTVLRYREKDGWHACDQMAMRAAIEAALAAKTEKSNGCA